MNINIRLLSFLHKGMSVRAWYSLSMYYMTGTIPRALQVGESKVTWGRQLSGRLPQSPLGQAARLLASTLSRLGQLDARIPRACLHAINKAGFPSKEN